MIEVLKNCSNNLNFLCRRKCENRILCCIITPVESIIDCNHKDEHDGTIFRNLSVGPDSENQV